MQKDPDSPILSEMQEGLGSPETRTKASQKEAERILQAIRRRMDIPTIADIPAPRGPRSIGVFGPERPRNPLGVEYIFSDRDIRLLGQFLNSSPNLFEIEASFGTVGGKRGGFKPRLKPGMKSVPTLKKKHGGFKPGLKSFPAFQALKKRLDEKAAEGKVEKTTSSEIVETMKDLYIRRITKLDSGDVVWQKKLRGPKDPRTQQPLRFENPRWGIRVYKSSESYHSEGQVRIEMEEQGFDIFKPTVRRFKRRTSYLEYQETSPFYGVRFDLTLVEETHYHKGEVIFSFTRGEIEIERVYKNVTTDSFIGAVQQVLEWTQRAKDFSTVIALSERKFAVKLHNNLFWYQMRAGRMKEFTDLYRLYSNYWNKPRNVKIRDLLNPGVDWSLTVKLNGVRRFLLLDTFGTYMVGPPFDVIKIGPGVDQFSGTLIDGEIMEAGKRAFYCFDLLFDSGEDIRDEDFRQRKERLDRIFGYLKGLPMDTQMHLKKYYSSGSLYQRIEAALDEADEMREEDQDGLIFQPYAPRLGYWNNLTLKWKPPEKLTIDFLVEAPDPTRPEKVRLLVGDRRRNIPFQGNRRHPLPEYHTLPETEVDEEPLSGRIVEFRWDRQTFVPLRVREDRDRPNNLRTALDVWEDIMNPITRDTIYGDTLQVVRRYLNSVKRTLLTDNFSQPHTILDIGSGRGGDLSKWKQAKIKKVYAVEPDATNLKEFKRRMAEMRDLQTEVQIVNMGAEETKKISMILDHDNAQLDGIVAFFSLTFFPENQKMYSSLIETINLLPEGGKFIGIVMDGARTRELLEKAKEQSIDDILKKGKEKAKKASKKQVKVIRQKAQKEASQMEKMGAVYESRAFTIEQRTTFTDKAVGNKIRIDIDDPGSMVKDQEEWLFYFKPFANRLKKIGFSHKSSAFRTREYSSDFVDGGDVYKILPKTSQTFSSLFRVFVFVKGKKFSGFSAVRPKAGTIQKFPNPYGAKLCMIGILPTPSNIIRAVLQGLSADYRSKSDKKKENFVRKFRRNLGGNLTLSKFRKLSISSILEQDFSEEHGEDAMKIAHLEYKLHIMNPQKWLSEGRILELLADKLKINIYVLMGKVQGPPRGKQKVVSVSASTRFSQCSEMYKREKAIILFTTDGIHYLLVSRPLKKDCSSVDETSCVFLQTDPLIQKIYKQVCPRTSI